MTLALEDRTVVRILHRSVPTSKLAEIYGVTDRTIRNICKESPKVDDDLSIPGVDCPPFDDTEQWSSMGDLMRDQALYGMVALYHAFKRIALECQKMETLEPYDCAWGHRRLEAIEEILSIIKITGKWLGYGKYPAEVVRENRFFLMYARDKGRPGKEILSGAMVEGWLIDALDRLKRDAVYYGAVARLEREKHPNNKAWMKLQIRAVKAHITAVNILDRWTRKH